MKYKIFKFNPHDSHFWYSIDANYDNQFTISDILILIKKIILFPGDLLIMWKSIWATNLVIFSCFLLHSLAAGDKFSKKTFSMCAINSNKSLHVTN